MAETQLFFIGTSKKTEIRMSGQVTYQWGAYGKWTKFKSPVKYSAKNVKYNKKTKNKAGKSKYGNTGAGRSSVRTYRLRQREPLAVYLLPFLSATTSADTLCTQGRQR